jgi:hypothetical protein
MKIEKALLDACYRQMTSKDFHVDETGITFSISDADLALIQAAGEVKLKKAMTLALKRKTLDDVREIYGDGAET